jgi:hypothetical protein
MTEETSFLPPGALPLVGADLHIIRAVGRIGDALVYDAREGERGIRLREYCPAGVVRRAADGTFQPAEPRFAAAWQDAMSRFLAQGHRLASIDHFGVAPIRRAVSVKAGGVLQGAYLIGEPGGESLSAALDGGLQLAPAQVMRIADDLGDTLAELHSRGLTHLDISPATVSIASGSVELSDFAVDNRPFMALLQSQEGFVRPGYSPIEHYDASMAEPLGPPADVYAASALLFRLIKGRDPAPWQERWRDAGAEQLADSDSYPPSFVEALRRGMSIEPDDRFPDGAAWQAAMALPPTVLKRALPASLDRSVTVPFEPAEPSPARPAEPIRLEPVAAPKRLPEGVWAWLMPLLFFLTLGVIVIGGYVAYQQRWFEADDPAADPTIGNAAAVRPAPTAKAARERVPPVPQIEAGDTVSGQLTARDRRRDGGQAEDRFALRGKAGDRLELRLSSGDFDPLIGITGGSLSAANDDDAVRGTRDSRLRVTIPRDGTYTISVSSAVLGASGDYLLQVLDKPLEISIATPAMLVGRWRAASDRACEEAAIITIEGNILVYDYGGLVQRTRILDGIGRTIRTLDDDANEDSYTLAEDGGSFRRDGGTWVRC